jgi:hypothetical protein
MKSIILKIISIFNFNKSLKKLLKIKKKTRIKYEYKCGIFIYDFSFATKKNHQKKNINFVKLIKYI